MRTSKKWGIALSVLFAIISLFYLMPIAVVLINSFKDNIAVNSNVFALPNQETFVGWSNYVNGLTSGAYPFLYSAGYSFMITILSAILILLCTSMAAWYISRVDDIASRVVYFLCVFSMVVPFQMVMFTLARTAYTLKLNTPWSIPVVYLGFGAGLAVFMFSGFVKGMPLAMEEAAAIDGHPHVLRRGAAHHEAHLHFRGRAGNHVGMERLSAALPSTGQHQVQDHPHPHPVSAGQLRPCRPGRHDGADYAEHPAHHHLLPVLPEVHHRGRNRGRGKRLKKAIP